MMLMLIENIAGLAAPYIINWADYQLSSSQHLLRCWDYHIITDRVSRIQQRIVALSLSPPHRLASIMSHYSII